MTTTPLVFVGLSGGVDSSVAALRLKAAGYQVVGVFIKVWHPDWLVCNWEQERLDAMRVAAKLEIPFLTCDGVTAYRDEVATYFIESYRAGKTPNPDIMCNRAVKFGAFLEFAKAHGADYIATGHYAQKITDREGNHHLVRGVDPNKDQSYFLSMLTQDQLDYALFPIGDTPKDEVRKEAAAAGLLTAEKRDSQGVCFLGHIDIPEFLSHYIPLTPGPVLNTSGETIGEHRGAFVYTLGQRHGFTLTNHDPNHTPHYVVAKDVTTNTITVSPEPPQLESHTSLTLILPVWRGSEPVVGTSYLMQSRYRQTPVTVTVTAYEPGKTLVVQPVEVHDAIAAGQSCVLYEGEYCRGGGIMS
jgi:tRNA-uridine 2-sulfurtransferase